MANLLGTIRDVVVVLAGIAGVAFGFYKYWKNWEGAAILQIELALNVFPNGSSNLVDITIQINNSGKSDAKFSSEELQRALCKICKVANPSNDVQLRWNQALEDNKLLEDANYVGEWMDYYPDEPMIFQPNTTETFHVFFATDYSGPIWVRAELVDNDDYKWAAETLFVLPRVVGDT